MVEIAVGGGWCAALWYGLAAYLFQLRLAMDAKVAQGVSLGQRVFQQNEIAGEGLNGGCLAIVGVLLGLFACSVWVLSLTYQEPWPAALGVAGTFVIAAAAWGAATLLRRVVFKSL